MLALQMSEALRSRMQEASRNTGKMLYNSFMNELETLGRWILIGGVILLVVGAIIWLIGHFSGLSNLPGTIRIQGSGFTCFIPILGSIILSIILTLVLNIVARLFK